MGRWAQASFGRSAFHEVGLVIAGSSSPEQEQAILGLFDEGIASRHSVFHGHVVRKDELVYPLVLNVYGGSSLVDALAVMHDGGCRTVLFVGLAGGDIVIPNIAHHLDGLYTSIAPGRTQTFPDKMLKTRLEAGLTDCQIAFHIGTHISVPAVSLQPSMKDAHFQALNPDTVDLELAACRSRAADLGMRAAGVLIVSDNRTHPFGTKDRPL